jgi:hypothetical protein
MDIPLVLFSLPSFFFFSAFFSPPQINVGHPMDGIMNSEIATDLRGSTTAHDSCTFQSEKTLQYIHEV